MHQHSGKVSRGKGRGKELGFPTANLKVSKTIPTGIYISSVEFDKKTYGGITFIGSAQTFGETQNLSETYILDFDKDIYNEVIRIDILQKIRDSEKFRSVEELINAMKSDLKKAEKFFQTRKYV